MILGCAHDDGLDSEEGSDGPYGLRRKDREGLHTIPRLYRKTQIEAMDELVVDQKSLIQKQNWKRIFHLGAICWTTSDLEYPIISLISLHFIFTLFGKSIALALCRTI